MTDRIDAYFDRRLDWAALTREERRQVEAVQDVVDATKRFAHARVAPDFAAGVMHEIERRGVPAPSRSGNALTRAFSALWTSRRVSFAFRPAYGLLGAAAVVTTLALLVPRVSPPASAGSSSAPHVLVQFRLQVPEASSVRLAGSFTSWQAEHELHQAAPGLWAITIPLPPGVHDYAFVIDGKEWVADPFAPAVRDGFGGTSSRLSLVPPDRTEL